VPTDVAELVPAEAVDTDEAGLEVEAGTAVVKVLAGVAVDVGVRLVVVDI